MTEDDYKKVRRWFDRGEASDGLKAVLLNDHPQARCEVAAAMRDARTSMTPITSFSFDRREILPDTANARARVVGPTTCDFYALW